MPFVTHRQKKKIMLHSVSQFVKPFCKNLYIPSLVWMDCWDVCLGLECELKTNDSIFTFVSCALSLGSFNLNTFPIACQLSSH